MIRKLKRLINLLISLGFFAAVRFRDIIRQLVGKPVPGTSVVLYYHAIPSEHRARFARQMDILLRWAKPVRADFRPPLNQGDRSVAVTFDDGLVSFIENALPELEGRRIPAALFVVTGKLGGFADWDHEPWESQDQEAILSCDQLRDIPSCLITIGSHTMTHRVLVNLNENEAKAELQESRATLEKILGRSVTLFSFPEGAFNEKLIDWCRETGYDRVFTSQPISAFLSPEEYVTGRVRADPRDWLLEFKLKVAGAYRWLPLAFAVKKKLLSNCHLQDLGNEP